MRRWLPVAILVAVSVGALAAGITLDRARRVADGEPRGVDGPETPVLSARRVPTVVAEPIARRRLSSALDDWLGRQDAVTCLEVRVGDEPVHSHRRDEPMVPASTEKLLVAAGVLLALGPDTRFETVVAGAMPDADGVVSGDVHLIGGGDPVLATRDYAAHFDRQPQIFTDFDGLADALVEAGVTRVAGSIVSDEDRFDSQRYLPDRWPARFIANDLSGPLSALGVNDGFAEYPTGDNGVLDVVPHPDPPRHAAALLVFLLGARGVVVDGAVRVEPAPDGVSPIASVQSRPVRDLVTQMLRESDNTTAELLLKELGHQLVGVGSTQAGSEALAAVLAEAGFDLGGVRIADGSGLSGDDRVTCALLADILGDDRVEAEVTGGLAVAGTNGTLEKRFVGTDLAGRLRAKTGTLNQVTALAGEVVTDGGATVQFAYLANVESSRRITAELIDAQTELGLILQTHPRPPDLDALLPR